MTGAQVGTLSAARQLLGWCVLHGVTCQARVTVPAGIVSLAIAPRGALPALLAAFAGDPVVRRVVSRHLDLGAVRFDVPAADARLVTAAGFAHLALCLLDVHERERFEERAAVREYDGAMSRPAAELFALFDVLDRASVVESVAALAAAA